MKLTELLTALLFAAALPAAAQMNYQGRLTDASGNPLADGQQTLEFSLWDLATGGTAALNQVWGPYTLDGSAGRPKADLASGRFNVVLGPLDSTNRPLTGAFNGPRFIQIKVGTNPAISPRQQILAAPTALHADHATNADTAANFTSVVLKTDEVNARVGIGLANPAEKLDVAGNVKVTGNLAASGSVGIGIPPTPGVLLNVSNNGGANESLRLSGAAINATQGTSTQGISFLLGLNRDDLERTDLMIGNSRKLGANDSVLRIIPGLGNTGSLLASVTPDGSTFKDLGLQDGQMTIKANGNVGIGTTGPSTRLQVVKSGSAFPATSGTTQSAGHLARFADTSTAVLDIGGFGGSGYWLQATNQNNLAANYPLMLNPNGGNVGIGTTNPLVKLDVIGSSNLTMLDNGYNNNDFANSGTVWAAAGTFAGTGGIELYGMWGPGNLPAGHRAIAPVGIRADGWIATARGFITYSDRRIKRDMQASPKANDLAAIQQLRVTDYRMVDPADGGMAWRKGFIAQEVEKVMPLAVTRGTEFVPDIFSVATAVAYDPAAKTLALTLIKNHDLRIGDRVRLHIDGKREDLSVSAVPSAREFVVEQCENTPEKVLVYGKQVNDFRNVDYDHIFTTSVGAVQELARQLAAKDARIAALEKSVADLQTKDKARDTKLAAIEAILSGDAGKARTVSLSR